MMKLEDMIKVGLGVLGIGFVLWRESETKKVVDKVGMAAERIMNSDDISVSQSLIDNSVRRAVDDRVEKTVNDLKSRVFGTLKEDITRQVRNAINECADKTASQVGEEIGKQAMNIDKDYLLKKAIDKASEKALRKFDDKLGEIAEDLNDRLNDDGYSRRRRVIML